MGSSWEISLVCKSNNFDEGVENCFHILLLVFDTKVLAIGPFEPMPKFR
jgi:hypothetical protein